jgi:hypothetical protein
MKSAAGHTMVRDMNFLSLFDADRYIGVKVSACPREREVDAPV